MTPRTSSYFSGEVKLVVKLGGAGGGVLGCVCWLIGLFWVFLSVVCLYLKLTAMFIVI